MNTPDWLKRRASAPVAGAAAGAAEVAIQGAVPASAVARPARAASTSAAAQVASPVASTRSAAKPAEAAAPKSRSVPERLGALLKHRNEALSPRALRRSLVALQSIVDSQVSEVEGGKRARAFADWYSTATPQERHDAWLLMSEQFSPKSDKVKAARAHYEQALGTPDEGAAEIRLRRAFVSPRTRLLQRFSVFPAGVHFLVDLRADLLPHLKADKRLAALDAELEHLFSTWFDVAFLELRRISWDSPASLIEKLIKYEAVHAIKGWADVKNRLDSDRRCYGFFHPRLPDEPLIFVEVAFMDDMAASIVPLLDEAAAAVDMSRASTAIFYSISNTQPGLRGVSFGDSLIKRVVETLREEFPKLKVFATLSPIPGFRAWLAKNAADLLAELPDKEELALQRALGEASVTAPHFLRAIDTPAGLDEKSPVRAQLMRCAALYLGRALDGGKPMDPVARFHLGNGARVERLNWMGDPSPKGLKQSFGLMVNYLYDLKRLDKHRSALAQGKIPVASGVQDLYS